MLQQTRVETVAPYFERFAASYPTPLALAEAPEDEVLSAWSGLGYYRRARLLHAGARAVASRGSGLPRNREGLLELPGIGRYTAGAIASIAFGEAVGLVDGNVARVFARLFAIDDDMRAQGMRRAERLAEAWVHPRRPGDWNQALMELGATVCTPRAPACDRCPIATECLAHAAGPERVLELPRLGKKAEPKRRLLQALVVRRGGHVLLARRRPDGLFGGLWEPPTAFGGPAALQKLVAAFPAGALGKLTETGTVTHVLSHRRLTITVHAGDLRIDPDAAALALPEPYETSGLFDEARLGGHGGPEIGLATLAHKILGVAPPSAPPGSRARARARPRRSK